MYTFPGELKPEKGMVLDKCPKSEHLKWARNGRLRHFSTSMAALHFQTAPKSMKIKHFGDVVNFGEFSHRQMTFDRPGTGFPIMSSYVLKVPHP